MIRYAVGDVVREYAVGDIFEVVFTDWANFGLKGVFREYEYQSIDPSYSETTLEIVGNIHDNPELMEG